MSHVEVGITSLLLAGVLTAMILPILRRFALDVPNHRSTHTRVTPRGGGVPIAVSVLTVGALALTLSRGTAVALAALAALAFLGLIDDLRPISPTPRLVIETMASIAITLAALGLPETTADSVVVASGTVFVVASINAFNFMDGINGISATTTIVGFCWFLFLGFEHDFVPLQLTAISVICSTIVFLALNARGALFLGDSGAYFLGGSIALAALYALANSVPWWQAVAPLILYGIDTALTLVRRVAQGESPTEAHRDHIYQRVVQNGINPLAMAFMCGVGTTICCVVSLATNPAIAIAAWIFCASAYVSLPRITSKKTTPS